MRFWVYIPPNNAHVPPMSLLKMSHKTVHLLLLEGRYITEQSIKKSPQTLINQGFAGLFLFLWHYFGINASNHPSF